MTDTSPPVPRFLIPAGEASAEITIKNSVFVGTVAHVADAIAALETVERMRRRYPDANHHAWAYAITGGPQAQIGSSDDGEPGGTAGRPMLAVLQGSALVEAVAVGTRYFGGIKLGTGGLVRAYSDCIRAALERLPVAEMVYHCRAAITVDYGAYGSLKYRLPRHGVRIEEETFGEHIRLSLGILPENVDALTELLRESTAGQVILSECIQGGYYVRVAV
jgi:uncharacterized YigZ family protein